MPGINWQGSRIDESRKRRKVSNDDRVIMFVEGAG